MSTGPNKIEDNLKSHLAQLSAAVIALTPATQTVADLKKYVEENLGSQNEEDEQNDC
ncbi:MAG: hypothetical protein JKY17_06450 [Magnetovibrio sp.]|nr:hypothetical protein [Magnetovibrio sp.]